MYTDGGLVACGGVTQRHRYIIITLNIGLVSYSQSQPGQRKVCTGWRYRCLFTGAKPGLELWCQGCGLLDLWD